MDKEEMQLTLTFKNQKIKVTGELMDTAWT